MMRTKAIIFDLDRVIIDSEGLHNDTVSASLAALGVTLPASFVDEFMGIPDEVLLAHVSRTYLAEPLRSATCWQKSGASFAYARPTSSRAWRAGLHPTGAPALPGVSLAASSIRVNQQIAFDRFALHGYFDVVVTAEDVQHTKPDPEPYPRVLPRSCCCLPPTAWSSKIR